MRIILQRGLAVETSVKFGGPTSGWSVGLSLYKTGCDLVAWPCREPRLQILSWRAGKGGLLSLDSRVDTAKDLAESFAKG